MLAHQAFPGTVPTMSPLSAAGWSAGAGEPWGGLRPLVAAYVQGRLSAEELVQQLTTFPWSKPSNDEPVFSEAWFARQAEISADPSSWFALAHAVTYGWVPPELFAAVGKSLGWQMLTPVPRRAPRRAIGAP